MNLPNLLTVLFVGLKLTDHIDWPWLLVLAPTLIPAGLSLCFVIAGAIVGYLGRK